MTPPRTPYDDELRRYSAEMRELLDSRPPSKSLSTARQEVAARLDTPTGIHYLDELQKQLQAHAIEVVKDKLAHEKQRAEAAEAIIRGFWKWLAGILAAVLATLIAALILRKL